jgi:HNH endonuclease
MGNDKRVVSNARAQNKRVVTYKHRKFLLQDLQKHTIQTIIKKLMRNNLTIPVLGLNAHWMATSVHPAAKAIAMIYCGTATAICTDNGNFQPMKWKEWKALPIGEEDDCIKSLHGNIRIPRLIIALNYKRIKRQRLSLNNKNLAKYFNYRCAYTGEHVPLEEGSMDHIIPKTRGGEATWSNAAWTSKRRNNMKDNRTPEEAGLSFVIPPPKGPPELLPAQKIHMDHGVRFPEWERFLESIR